MSNFVKVQILCKLRKSWFINTNPFKIRLNFRDIFLWLIWPVKGGLISYGHQKEELMKVILRRWQMFHYQAKTYQSCTKPENYIRMYVYCIMNRYLNVINVKPWGWELESLTLENPLTFSVEINLLFPALHLSLQSLDVSDEVHGLRGWGSLDGLLLHVTAWLGNLEKHLRTLNQNYS